MSNKKQQTSTTTQKPKTEIMTYFGPLSQLEKEVERLAQQLQEQKNINMEKQFKIIERQRMRVAKIRPYTLESQPTQKQDQIAIDGDLVRGSRLYTSQCMSCHSLDANSYYKRSTGPALGLIYQRRNASDLHFTGYSDNFLKRDFMWTANKLNLYLKNPKQMIPGSKCNFIKGGLQSEEDRVDLITFMREYSKGLAVNLRMKMEKKLSKDALKSKDQVSKRSQEKEKSRR